MSQRDPQKYLYDILSSCEFLLGFTRNKTVDDYTDDRAFRSAVERELQIIGEALMQLDKVSPETAMQIPDYLNTSHPCSRLRQPQSRYRLECY